MMKWLLVATLLAVVTAEVNLMEDDLDTLSAAIKSSTLSKKEKAARLHSLHKVQKHAAHLSQLEEEKARVDDEISALKQQLQPQLRTHENVARVSDDVRQLEEAVHSSKFPTAVQDSLQENLDRISHDAREFETSSKHSRKLLKKAMNLRLQSVRNVMETESRKLEEQEQARKAKLAEQRRLEQEHVLHDVLKDLRAMAKTDDFHEVMHRMPEMKGNLDKIWEDAKTIAKSDTQSIRDRLGKAINFRIEAIREALTESRTPESVFDEKVFEEESSSEVNDGESGDEGDFDTRANNADADNAENYSEGEASDNLNEESSASADFADEGSEDSNDP